MNIDYGLSVTFDGKSYTLMDSELIKEYPIGGLIAEYCCLSPTEIKPVLMQCHGLDNPVTVDNLAPVVVEFHEKLLQAFPPVTAIMISLEFQNSAHDWIAAIKENRIDELKSYYKIEEGDQITPFIMADTPYQDYGCETILQLLLSCYFSFGRSFVNTKYMFTHILGEEGDSSQRKTVLSAYDKMYGEMMDMQHIDYRILATVEKGLESLFTIKSSISLLLFEMAHATQVDQQFVKCENCGRVFVPEGRSDTIYCNYPSPQNKEKTCREIGAQIARANKEKNDVCTREYRKAYMRYKMKTQRHPGNKEAWEKFTELTTDIKEWRTRLDQGTTTTEEFLSWLESFK